MPADLNLWGPLLRAPFFTRLTERLANGESELWLSGLVESARALVLSLVAGRLQRGVLLVVNDDASLTRYLRDFAAFGALNGRDPRRVLAFPALDADPWDGIAPHPEVVRERVVALNRLTAGALDVLIVPARALLSLLPGPDEWQRGTHSVALGSELSPESFVLDAIGLGYRRVDTVSAPGEISRRGGIIDLFPPTADEPVRIELFGDSVESLRSFDTDNQRSTGQLERIAIGPAVENPPTERAVRKMVDHLEGVNHEWRDDVRQATQARELLEQLRNQGYWPGFEALAGMTAETPTLLSEHAAEMLLVIDEPSKTAPELERAAHELEAAHELSENRILPGPHELFADPAQVLAALAQPALSLQELVGQAPAGAEELQVSARAPRAYAGRVHELAEDLRPDPRRPRRTVCVMRAPGSADRLSEILDEYDLTARRIDRQDVTRIAADAAGGVFVGVGPLRSGFELPELGLIVLSEQGVFGEKRKAEGPKGSSRAAFISDFRDLKKGDLVVHVDHGVASFAGLGRPRGGSLNRDFMMLEFAARDRLFIPVDRLDLVQKYSGVAGSRPSLDKLGSPGWERIKARVRKSVESMARELLELYARRKAATGHAFSQDTPWQRELEEAFPYELTPDQQRALSEIKQDMESDRPMDRLLVGDVGFGKTEVAIRAACKSVMDGRQAAVLTPTTVLTMQHFDTFVGRFAPFPVRVEMISRFRSAAESRRILEDLATGAVDVIIGTHRLLSKDIQFKQLGLLVVDEEQRFGVTHKERLKKLAIGVDVLSMTATPIPRTLQMSMAGVRDLSVIETPPPGRMSIQTYLVPFRKNLIAQAIRQELRRGGQVFVVHNKIETLPALARALGEMVPEARIVMAHGRVSESTLESVMMRFVQQEADVLVTTTIIENGLDIPNANTIVVNRADRFGLAQLYQLRGRVGRSHRHAYAYFVIPGRQHLTDEAAKRLRALQDFSELGAGFRLAAADLEIRGAGELLGSRQHGHIASLGFDLYCQMLERSVQEMQGEPVVERKPVNLGLGVDIKIPQNYLPDAGDRLVLYKRLAQASSGEEIDQLRGETEDRFGHLPESARNLFSMGHLRLVAEACGVKSVELTEDQVQVRFHDRPPIDPAYALEVVSRQGGSVRPSGMVVLPGPRPGEDRISGVHELLSTLHRGRPAADDQG